MIKIKFIILAFLVSAQKIDDEADRLMTENFKKNGSGGIALIVKDG